MPVIHIQTTIQTVLGVLDADGNVVEQVPLTVNVQALKPEMFAEAARRLAAQRAEIEGRLAKPPAA